MGFYGFNTVTPSSSAVTGGQPADLFLEFSGQLGLFQPPAPVLAHGGGLIDAGGVVQPQPVLHGDDAVAAALRRISAIMLL